MSVTERVRELVVPVLRDAGLELFDVEFSGGHLRVLADKTGGADLDALTHATHRISAILDREDPVPGGRYILEVSSPGLERPLRTPDHFRHSIGQVVSVKTRPGTLGDRRTQGLLSDVDDDGFTVGGRRFTYEDVERARTVFEWGAATKPGRSRVGATSSRTRQTKGTAGGDRHEVEGE
jgi:ribosome maturation factor RimP